MSTNNINFPLKDDVTTNSYFGMTQITKDALSSDLILLLTTQIGERLYMPEYGCNLLKYIFEPNDGLTADDVEAEIKRMVSLYIPALTIKKVTFNWNTDADGAVIPETQLNVNIKFVYNENAFSEGGSLDLQF